MTQVTQREGNTKASRDIRGRKWVFTLNNYSDTETQNYEDYLKKNCVKWIFGFEIGESGTPHLQGYFEFKNPRSFSSIKKVLTRAHFERARGSLEENYEYTSKDGNYRYGGFYPEQIGYTRTIHDEDLYSWQRKILDILNEKPDDRSIHWYWERDGCSGKTTFQKHVFCNYENVLVLGGKSSDMKNGIVQYKKINDYLPGIILINITRAKADYVSYTGIEEIKDMFFYSGKYEGGMVCGPNPHVIVFANSPPDRSQLSEDRWHVVNID